MTTTDVVTSGRFDAVLDPEYYNKIGGAAFASWGLIHVVVGGIGLAIFFTGGTGPMLKFVNIDPAVNEQAARMSALVAEFYQALLLIGLTTIVIGVTLNLRGEPFGLGLSAILVVSFEARGRRTVAIIPAWAQVQRPAQRRLAHPDASSIPLLSKALLTPIV